MQKNGRRGQRQNGVDVFGRRQETSNWVGIQCKVKSTGERLTEAEICIEIQKALNFNPKLSEYILVTTASRDQKLQEFVREKTLDYLSKGFFQINLVFWEDIELDLTDKNNLDIYYRYYRDFFIDVKNLGNAVGKLITIRIGIGEFSDTQYELIIGRTPPRSTGEDYLGINYYKDSYYIINLSAKTFDTFSVPCYPSDFEYAFRNRRDGHIISQWINNVNLEELVYAGEISYLATITYEEYKQFLEEMKD